MVLRDRDKICATSLIEKNAFWSEVIVSLSIFVIKCPYSMCVNIVFTGLIIKSDLMIRVILLFYQGKQVRQVEPEFETGSVLMYLEFTNSYVVILDSVTFVPFIYGRSSKR